MVHRRDVPTRRTARLAGSLFGLALLAAIPGAGTARDALAAWNDRCEYCHGDAAGFSRKYLWNVGGELQGQHHIHDLQRFLAKHYVPAHEVEPIRRLLLADANSPGRFEAECGECHGSAAAFVEKSLWIRGSGITGMATGRELEEFLPTHRDLEPEEVEFYLKLLVRVADTR